MTEYPIIVLEGPDGSGKTTLANAIAKWNGARYLHLTYRFKNKMFDYHTAAIELCSKYAQHQPVVLDRWWPSEKVYADVFRGGSKWPLGGRMLDRVALKLGVTYIICLPKDKEEHLARFKRMHDTGREMYDTVDKVYDEYAELYKKVGGRYDWIHYDIDRHGKNLDDYAQWIIDRATDIHQAQPTFWRDPNNRMVAGNGDDASILLVGDQSRPKTRRTVWPFFQYGDSSLWLTNALEECNIPENKLSWVNAHDANGNVSDALHQALRHTQARRVVTLGDNASDAVRSLGYTRGIYKIKHPQFYRRFRPRDLREVSALREFI